MLHNEQQTQTTTSASMDTKPIVSRSAYVIWYSSIGEDLWVRIEASSIKDALLAFERGYHFVDTVYSITKAE